MNRLTRLLVRLDFDSIPQPTIDGIQNPSSAYGPVFRLTRFGGYFVHLARKLNGCKIQDAFTEPAIVVYAAL